MKIQRLVKYYFGLVAIIFVTTSVADNTSVRNYMANTLHIEIFNSTPLVHEPAPLPEIKQPTLQKNSTTLLKNAIETTFPFAKIDLNLSGDPTHTYSGIPEIKTFQISSEFPDLNLKTLRLTPQGINLDQLTDAKLLIFGEGEEDASTLISQGRIASGQLVFSNLKHDLAQPLTLVIGLTDDTLSGTHFTFIIENAEDLSLTLSGRPHTLDREYPIVSPSITVIKPRLPQRLKN